MSLPGIEPAELQIFLFGPGTGELVAVRVPPGAWLIVDGCGVGEILYAPALLAHYKARPAMVIFTHPHRDHYRGLQEIVDEATADPAAHWPILGMVAPPEAATQTGSVLHLVPYLAKGGAEHATAAIADRWDRRPECRWTLQPGETRPLGEAIVRALSPTVRMRQVAQWNHEQQKAFDLNQISAAVAVEWMGHRIVLGSDLVEKPGQGWTDALAADSGRGSHRVLKIPHHGSLPALHLPLLAEGRHPAPSQWIVTPFARWNLPSFETDDGMDLLLEHRDTVELTALPRAHADQSATAESASIESLRPDGRHLTFDPATPGFPDCFVVLSLKADGSGTLTRGPGSVTVTR